MSSELICADVFELILMRLPVKSLYRFKSVAKSWNHTISEAVSNRDFMLAHRRHSKIHSSSKKNMFLALWSFDAALISLSKLENNELKLLPVDLERRGSFVGRVESCDGLILILWKSCAKRSIHLWNPSARKYTNLGTPFSYPRGTNSGNLFAYPYVFTCGIGFDPISKDYKIVAANVSMKQYSVFNSKRRCWNESKIMEITIADDIRSFSLDGHICLQEGYEKQEETNSYDIKLVLFNPRDNKFYQCVYNTGQGSSTATSYCLYACSHGQFCALIGDMNSDVCRVVWKKRSGEWSEFDGVAVPWTMYHKFDDDDLIDGLSIRMLFTDDDGELIFSFGYRKVLVYSLIEKTSKLMVKPDGVVRGYPLIGYSDNLFFGN
ncbi:F-box protein At3g19470-like [Andrographis paniculata]|uniref:F-box protein At3g19470-like n=1 Tax=Andrographis paniculata TaxID=175694 RepID=UPI0021E93A2D|nr:F-box protein At3g19470-like [Andrographis paniculata]